jgi:poly(A) polymerase
VVLPEADCDGLTALVAEEARQQLEPDALRRLAALLPADADLASLVAARFRLSTAQKKRLMSAARRDARQSDPRALAYRLGPTQALDRLLLTGQSTEPIIGWEIPTFPLKGGQIVARGVSVGPEVARILCSVEDRWVAEGFPDEKRVQHLLDEEIGG